MKTLSTSIALLLLLLASSFLQTSMAGSVFCDSNCGRRCSKTEKKDSCLKYCGICCATCHCVPSGTYGNKDECPCYRDMRSKKKKTPKCP